MELTEDEVVNKQQRRYAVASPGFSARRGKMEIASWGTHGGLQGWVQQLLDD